MNMLVNLFFRLGTVYTDAGLPNGADGDFSKFGDNVKNLVFIVAGVIALYIILSGGFKYVTSGGNPESTKKAGQTILFGVVGLIILMLSYTIMTWVFKVGGI